jgi:hypothetical protein
MKTRPVSFLMLGARPSVTQRRKVRVPTLSNLAASVILYRFAVMGQ